MSYSSTTRASGNPYVLPPTASHNCCSNSSGNSLPSATTSCCAECQCCRPSYEHLPMPRLQQAQQQQFHQHQTRQQQQHQQSTQHQQHHQVSCITTLQQTTTTQPVSCQIAPQGDTASCQRLATTAAAGYLSNVLPPATQHCHANCNRHCGSNNSCGNNEHNNAPPGGNSATPMFFVPFSMPLSNQQHFLQQQHHQQTQQQHLQQQLPELSLSKLKPSYGQTPAPPPPQPPPLLLPFTLQCHLQQLTAATAQSAAVAGQLPAHAPPMPLPPRQVLPLKLVAAAAIRAHQQVSWGY